MQCWGVIRGGALFAFAKLDPQHGAKVGPFNSAPCQVEWDAAALSAHTRGIDH